MTKVILNADDFGRSLEHNRAIANSFYQGFICSAGLIVTGKYLKDAVELMNKGGYVENVHLHFNLSTSLRGGDPEDIPLTETMKNDFFFCKGGKFKRFRGLPYNPFDSRKWKIVYRELVAQYNKFNEVTEGKGNKSHVDFHLWYNLTFPVAIALNVFTRKYKIKSVRYIGIHQKSIRYRLFRWISWNSQVKSYPATNIDYYITKRKKLTVKPIIELYCHPNYKNGIFLDDSPSYLKHERQPLPKQIQMLRDLGNVEFISWEDITNKK